MVEVGETITVIGEAVVIDHEDNANTDV